MANYLCVQRELNSTVLHNCYKEHNGFALCDKTACYGTAEFE